MFGLDALAQLDTWEPKPVLLLCPGKAPFDREEWEPFLADRIIERLVKRFVEPGMEDFAYSSFYADEKAPGDIALEAQTYPFLVERRVIVVRNAAKYVNMSADKRSPLMPLLEYLKAPSPSTLLILIADKVDRRKAFFKACEASGDLIECPQLDDGRLREWAVAEAQARGKTFAPAALRELLDRAGNRLSDVVNAVSLVVNYAGGEEKITESDVNAACSDVSEETVWMLNDAIAAAETGKALETLHQLFGLGSAPDEIIGTINWLLESAYKSAPEYPHEKPKPFVMKKVMPLVQRYGHAKIRDALIMLTKTTFMTRTTGVDRELAVEMMIARLCAFQPPQRARR
jgi:DNA polymerase III subunit delta